jgi:pimeloyl-ACP methyl ester carboxylesterase
VKRLSNAAFALLGVFLLAVTALLPTVASTLAAGDVATKSTAGSGIVYFFRGGANIFSTGMDEVAEKLKARGVDAKSVGHASWRDLVDVVGDHYAATHQAVVIAGHSWGANAAVLFAAALAKRKVPVDLVVLFDPTAALQVSGNVAHVINFYSATAASFYTGTVGGLHLEVKGASNFTGTIENRAQLDLGHMELDNSTRVQDEAIGEILKALGVSQSRPAL